MASPVNPIIYIVVNGMGICGGNMLTEECVYGDHFKCMRQDATGTFKCECLCHKTVGE